MHRVHAKTGRIHLVTDIVKAVAIVGNFEADILLQLCQMQANGAGIAVADGVVDGFLGNAKKVDLGIEIANDRVAFGGQFSADFVNRLDISGRLGQ